MRSLITKLSLYFAAGCLGAVVNSLLLWYAGRMGVMAELGVRIAPELSPAWLYSRLVWGGLWGWLFFAPVAGRALLSKGVILSLIPSAVQLLLIFPYQDHVGFLGSELGRLTPVVVLTGNALWGLSAAVWLRLCRSG